MGAYPNSSLQRHACYTQPTSKAKYLFLLTIKAIKTIALFVTAVMLKARATSLVCFTRLLFIEGQFYDSVPKASYPYHQANG